MNTETLIMIAIAGSGVKRAPEPKGQKSEVSEFELTQDIGDGAEETPLIVATTESDYEFVDVDRPYRQVFRSPDFSDNGRKEADVIESTPLPLSAELEFANNVREVATKEPPNVARLATGKATLGTTKAPQSTDIRSPVAAQEITNPRGKAHGYRDDIHEYPNNASSLSKKADILTSHDTVGSENLPKPENGKSNARSGLEIFEPPVRAPKPVGSSVAVPGTDLPAHVAQKAAIPPVKTGIDTVPLSKYRAVQLPESPVNSLNTAVLSMPDKPDQTVATPAVSYSQNRATLPVAIVIAAKPLSMKLEPTMKVSEKHSPTKRTTRSEIPRLSTGNTTDGPVDANKIATRQGYELSTPTVLPPDQIRQNKLPEVQAIPESTAQVGADHLASSVAVDKGASTGTKEFRIFDRNAQPAMAAAAPDPLLSVVSPDIEESHSYNQAPVFSDNEIRSTTVPANRLQLPQPFAENAPRIIQQIADSARALNDRPVDITLSPEELGRVRLTLQNNDGSMAVIVTVERSETMDLLRRHIELLANDLRDIGYRDVAFSFSGQSDFAGSSDAETQPDQGGSAIRNADRQPDQSLPPSLISLSGHDHIDIRL